MPAFSDRIRRAANRFYIDEVAAIREEPDDKIARERACRLNDVMDDTIIAARTGVLSPTAARLLDACDTIFSSATECKSAADQTSGGDRRPLPEVALSTRRECGVGSNAVPEGCGARTCAGSTKGGDHGDLDASGLPLTTPAGKLLQLRPGQDVAVFSDAVTWDGRRA